MSFDINQVKLFRQFLLPSRVPLTLQKFAVTFLSEFHVKFLGYERPVFIRFYWHFMVINELDVFYLTILLHKSKN